VKLYFIAEAVREGGISQLIADTAAGTPLFTGMLYCFRAGIL
jgi:hypothetical protein